MMIFIEFNFSIFRVLQSFMTRLYKLFYGMFLLIVSILPDMSLGPVAQSVAALVSPIADPGVANSISARSHYS